MSVIYIVALMVIMLVLTVIRIVTLKGVIKEIELLNKSKEDITIENVEKWEPGKKVNFTITDLSSVMVPPTNKDSSGKLTNEHGSKGVIYSVKSDDKMPQDNIKDDKPVNNDKDEGGELNTLNDKEKDNVDKELMMPEMFFKQMFNFANTNNDTGNNKIKYDSFLTFNFQQQSMFAPHNPRIIFIKGIKYKAILEETLREIYIYPNEALFPATNIGHTVTVDFNCDYANDWRIHVTINFLLQNVVNGPHDLFVMFDNERYNIKDSRLPDTDNLFNKFDSREYVYNDYIG